MECRSGCAACCTVISISSPLPGRPEGKRAGEACHHLNEEGFCRIHDREDYHEVCRKFRAGREFCGHSTEDAYRILQELEELTR